MEEVIKRFYEEGTHQYFRTLREAKKAGDKGAKVHRVWMQPGGAVMGSVVVWAYGELCCSVQTADESIAENLHKKEQMKQKIVRRFHEENSDTIHRTLSEAKDADRNPCVMRVWMRGDEIIGRVPVFQFGGIVYTVKDADGIIERRLRNKGVIV